MSRLIEDLLPVKPQARLRIYAWSTKDVAKYNGCLKVGQTTIDVNTRIRRSQGVAQFEYILEVDEISERDDGTFFRDKTVRDRLEQKGFENVEGEWMRCSAKDVIAAIQELRSGQLKVGNHIETLLTKADGS